MRDVYVIGAHTTKFGKHLDKTHKQLAAITVPECLKDAGLETKDIQAAWFSNSGWGMTNYQHSIRGQVAFRPIGIESIPITNVENACAGGSTAFNHAWMTIAGGLYDIALAVGVEKIYHPNKFAVFAGFLSGLDTEALAGMLQFLQERPTDKDARSQPSSTPKPRPKTTKKSGKKLSLMERLRKRRKDMWDAFVVYITLGEALGYDTVNKMRKIGGGGVGGGGGGGGGGGRSPFMDVYAFGARHHIKTYGSTQRQLAVIASKNHWHSTMNPNAQYTFPVSVEQVLEDREVSWPLTRAMCAPIGDGAASAILADEKTVKRLGLMSRAVKIRASILGSGRNRAAEEPDIGARLSKIAYEQSGLGPEDIDVCEVHDATAYGELHQSEALGFCPEGDGGIFAESGATTVGGKLPINPSGGLECRGHPIGASGLSQIHELITHLRGEAGERQVEGARIALGENGGGALGNEEAAMCIHIFEAPSK